MNSVDVAIGFVLRESAERRMPDTIIQMYAIVQHYGNGN